LGTGVSWGHHHKDTIMPIITGFIAVIGGALWLLDQLRRRCPPRPAGRGTCTLD
jgi:hypothetical protein